jgi:predicted permease
MWARLVALLSRLRLAWSRQRLDEESRSEFDAHIDMLVEMYMRSGMPLVEARAAARRQFGSAVWMREEVYHMNGFRWLDGWAQDFRYALRQVRGNPVFSAVVIGTLALGIGGTTAVFSVVQAVLLAPLPYEQPGQLVRIYLQPPEGPDTRHRGVSTPHFATLRDHAASLTDVAGMIMRDNDVGLDLFRDGQAQRLRVLQVTSGYFHTLRSDPIRGSGFSADDDGGARRVVLSHALWRARFSSDPSIVGATIQLSAEPYEVAGIAPYGFEDPIAGEVDVWTPYDLRGDTFEQNYSLTVIGRLRTGVSLHEAVAEWSVLSASLRERFPDVKASSIVALPLHEDLVAPSRALLHLLLIAVGLVLVVACVNVANLVLVRATGRAHEFAVRAALGCGRARLARQLFVESVVLAGIGGLLGLTLARFGVDALHVVGEQAFPRLDEIGFNRVVLGFAALLTLSTAAVSGVAPALRLARTDPDRALRRESRSATGGRSLSRLRSGLSALQLALALALMVGAGVLMASFHHLQQVDLGFRVERVLTFDINLPGVRYDADRRAVFHEDLARRIETIAGVTAAGGTSRLPGTGTYHAWPLHIETGPLAGTSVTPPEQPEHRTVSGNFFAVFDIPLLAGRLFDERDDANDPTRAVVSASFARLAFPGLALDRVIGQRFTVLGRQKREIVGVVGDVALEIYGTPSTTVYSAHRQFAANRNWALTQVVATALPPEKTLAAVRAEVAALDPALALFRVAPMKTVVGRSSGRQRFALVLLGAFAAVSLTLAAIGLYGVLSYAVRQRTPEIGIRIALGATAGHVRMLVLRQALLVLGIGLTAGIAGALVLARWLSSLLFKVNPWDGQVLLVTALVLTITGLVAAWLPARRAGRVEPRTAMQETAVSI